MHKGTTIKTAKAWEQKTHQVRSGPTSSGSHARSRSTAPAQLGKVHGGIARNIKGPGIC